MNNRALHAPRFAVTRIECFERPVTLRLPFRFGAATVHSASQAFVRATIRGTDGRTAQGMAAELMIPKWFDKSPDRSNARNLDDLRTSLSLAGDAYCSSTPPMSRMAMRSPIFTASSMSWVTNTTVFCTSDCRRRNSSCRRTRVTGSIAPKGSSMSRTGGSAASARATPTRWRWPPESCAGYRER